MIGPRQEARAAIPFEWRAMRGLPNVIAHQDGAVDPDQLHRTVAGRLPALVERIEAAFRER